MRVLHGDIRCASDLDVLPAVDVVLEPAANPSVLAGVDGRASSRQLVEHNLLGTVNMLEYCRRHSAAFVLLSTSRVYSIPPLAALPVRVREWRLRAGFARLVPAGLTADGSTKTSRQPRRCRSTAPRSSPASNSRSNTAARSASRCGSIAAASSRAPVNSAGRTRASSPSGLTAGCAAAR